VAVTRELNTDAGAAPQIAHERQRVPRSDIDDQLGELRGIAETLGVLNDHLRGRFHERVHKAVLTITARWVDSAMRFEEDGVTRPRAISATAAPAWASIVVTPHGLR
jgi:hypothetical protein